MIKSSSLLKSLLALQLLLISFPVFSQFTYTAEANIQVMASTSEEKLPFWMYHNQRGRISEKTDVAGWLSGNGTYFLSSTSTLEVGAGFLYQDGVSERIFIDELYTKFQNSWFKITAGRKQQPEMYNGLSASNKSILWSLNARPLPGLLLETTGPVYIFPSARLGFEASWGEYVMEKDRDVRRARVHHKSFHLVYNSSDSDFQIRAGLQHFAQWGGKSDYWGQQPEEFEDYLRIITGWGGGDSAFIGDQQNALGNHIGGYELSVSRKFKKYYLELFYQHIFEDGSGRRLGNTPDGRYGLFINSTNPLSIVNSVMYEFYTTHHQSHTTIGAHKNDNYFNNGIYRSGWTYENRVLGSPFFTVNPQGTGIINNKFTAHHLGIGGMLPLQNRIFPYKLLLSYAQNDGTRHIRFDPKQHAFYSYLNLRLLQSVIDVNLNFATEISNIHSPLYGAGLHMTYNL